MINTPVEHEQVVIITCNNQKLITFLELDEVFTDVFKILKVNAKFYSVVDSEMEIEIEEKQMAMKPLLHRLGF